MKSTELAMTEKEVQILLGVRNMYWGVPFLVAHKRRIGKSDELVGDAVWERLVAMRNTAREEAATGVAESGVPFVRLPLTKTEAGLFVEMTRACLEECGT